jgi:hypothetical protein
LNGLSLQKQHGHEQRFKEWYDEAQNRMISDALLAMLKDFRTETVV